MLQDFGGILLGLGLLLLVQFIKLDPISALLFFLVSCGILLVFIVDLSLFLHSFGKSFRKLTDDKSGLAWIWIVGFGLTLPLCALVYWSLDYPFDMIAEVAMGAYTLTGTMAFAWDTSRLIISYLLAFVVIFAVVWVITNSKNPNFWGS